MLGTPSTAHALSWCPTRQPLSRLRASSRGLRPWCTTTTTPSPPILPRDPSNSLKSVPSRTHTPPLDATHLLVSALSPPDPPHTPPHPSMYVPADRQVQIVDLGGLNLLLPLTKCDNTEVQRLSAHALANLSVNGALRRTRATGARAGVGGGRGTGTRRTHSSPPVD